MNIIDVNSKIYVIYLQDEIDNISRYLNVSRVRRSRRNEELLNASIICISNNNFNDSSIDYQKKLDEIEESIANKNLSIYIIRGANDDISFFNDCKIKTQHIHLIPDYTIIRNSEFSVLCIGGGISPHRNWLKKQQNTLYNREEEKCVCDIEVLNEMKENNIKFNIIVSNEKPTFMSLNNENLSNWFEQDDTLYEEIICNQMEMDKVYYWLIMNNISIPIWFFGNYLNDSSNGMVNILRGILFRCNSFNTLSEVNLDGGRLPHIEYYDDEDQENNEEYLEDDVNEHNRNLRQEYARRVDEVREVEEEAHPIRMRMEVPIPDLPDWGIQANDLIEDRNAFVNLYHDPF